MSWYIREIQPQDCSRWDGFVLGHPHGSPFHLLAWKKSIEETFHFEPHYLVAEDDTGIHGVLPLFLVQNLIVGKALISSPFAVYGGILADSERVRQSLHDEARKLGEKSGVGYVELRNAYAEQCLGVPNVARYVTFTCSVEPDEKKSLESLPKKTRNMVRKALKYPYVTRRHGSDFRAFEELYAKNMRRLGTPSFPKKHFSALLSNFGSMVDIQETVLDGKVVAASLNFYFRDQMHTYYAASDPSYNDKAPNNYMYFDHLRHAALQGYAVFDFGRCKRETGVFEFKRHWNTTMRELPYEVLLINRKEVPNFSPVNPRFEMAIAIWKKLPLLITRALGPAFVRLFP